MREFNIETKVLEAKESELPAELQQLVKDAKEATFRSYAPYSKFCVGAAILLDNGEVITGSNQENAAYPSGTCAERTACYFAHSSHPHSKFVAIAIAARDTSGEFLEEPISPCGACRQALLEYENLSKQPVRVILAARDKVYILESVADTLPFAFSEFE